ncbi:hypothetical protein DPEC_G00334510 [Dallia pectoralis]|uniref:Uncharacterized protein n=1 Tax=Dallia pectoralis TaxID=75939 RepID=A0ACC2F6R5_DALPE|nr:hypothetical protein DPEC_G00334510 [Dallia pectoralis]
MSTPLSLHEPHLKSKSRGLQQGQLHYVDANDGDYWSPAASTTSRLMRPPSDNNNNKINNNTVHRSGGGITGQWGPLVQ